MPVIDWSISVGNILTVLLLGLGAIQAYYRIQADIRVLKHDFKNLEQAQLGMAESMTILATTLTQIAVQTNRIDNLERTISELKRGDGYVLPLPFQGQGPR